MIGSKGVFSILPGWFFLSITLLLSTEFISQNQEVLRGRCVSESTQNPLTDVTVFVSGIESYTAQTDSNGNYELLVSAGNYQIMLEHPGFKSQVRENVIVSAGKHSVQNFDMSEYKVNLDPVTVKPEKDKDVELSLWNIQQYAAVFYDPARVVNSHAGVVNSDDQANQLTVRGTSPNYIQWKMEGVEVVNPNHLENAGTLNDRPALNGGGVSMISAQLLETSGFRMAPFSPLSGNVLSGIFDLRFRAGNEKKMERTVQASFLGTDICLEGPFSKKSKASYLVNFRYSTIGLLSKLGVNFGDEKTNYKDLSFVINYPFRNNTVKLFGMIGNSETLFQGKDDSLKVKMQKELQDINYNSLTSISGLSITTPLSNTFFVKTVVAYSSKEVTRNSAPSSNLWKNEIEEADKYNQQKLSGVCFLSKRIANHSRMKAGSYVNYFMTRINSLVNDVQKVGGTINESLVQPFLSFESSILRKVEFQFGLHGFYQDRIKYFALQPRAMVKYLLTDEQELSFNYGESAQLQPANLYVADAQNGELKPTRSQSFSLTHLLKFRSNTFKTELYYQLYDQVPINVSQGFSAFNYFNEAIVFELVSKGKGVVYGLDFTYEKYFKGFYMIPSFSIYNSAYTLGSTNLYNARFNTGYNAVLTCGKEFRLKDGRRYISIDLRGISRNGYMESASNEPSMRYTYSEQIPSYFRMDLRVSYRKNREKSTVIWALDIQNVSNNQNVAYHYFDRFTQNTETRYQLGLIPVLSYKIYF
ncbi:MAG: TonB-dependent receptor plug [Bacteroidetes bacterium]|jgi:hypothetical protein|nr:TonB-dependent receptor plug [Bacteroidota bacterium]